MNDININSIFGGGGKISQTSIQKYFFMNNLECGFGRIFTFSFFVFDQARENG